MHRTSILFIVAILSLSAYAEDSWPRFRGPQATGVSQDDPRLPERWGRDDNVLWQTEVPGWGWSCPVVYFAPVSTETAEEAFENVLLYAGAIRPKRDSHDERIVREVRSGRTTFGNGIIASQTDVGGWAELLSTQPEQDIDADGMPDEWERRFSPNRDLSLKNSLDLVSDGYTNVEEYLNQTNPTKSE